MAMGYGSNFELAELSRSQVGIVEPEPAKRSWVTLLRILITIAEVGLSLLPGVGLVAGTGIALGAATANTILDVETGQVNAVNTAINFGSAFIPGISAGVKALRPVLLSEMATARLGVFGANLIDELPEVELAFQKGISRGSEEIAKLRKFELNKVVNLLDNSGYGSSGFFERFVSSINPGRSAAGVEAVENIEEDTRKIEALSGVSAREAEELEGLLRLATTQGEKQVIVIDYLKSVGKLDALRRLAPLASDAELMNIMKQGNKVLLDTSGKVKNKVRSYLEALGKPNSREFNDNFVQKVQLLFDGNDAGRAPIEFAYGKIKSYINKEFKKLAKIVNKADKLEEAFTKTGGVIVDSSVILGYKLIHTIGYQSLVQITFYPQATRSPKNPAGKEPVYVFASKVELKNLRKRGMRYYKQKWATSMNGKGQIFGARVKSLFGGLTFFTGMFKINAIKNILSLASNLSTGFFGKGGIAEHGIFTGAWEKKFASSFSRNWKNRVGRLTGRVVIGGVAQTFLGHTIGSFIGREAQRAASQYIVPALTGQKLGSWQTAFATSFQSGLRRVARRRNPNGVAVSSLSAIRKGQIVQRVPGSFTAGKLALSNLAIKIPR